MNESVHAAEINERTEGDNRRDLSMTNFAGLEIVEEVIASFLLVLFKEGTTGKNNVVAIAIELDDLGVDCHADVWLKIANATKFNKRCRKESAKSDVDDESTLNDFDDGSVNNAFFFLFLLDLAPSLFVLSALLRKNEATLFVLKRKN